MRARRWPPWTSRIATARRHADGAAGRLAIGLSSTTGLPATPELLRAFGERYPDVALDVRHFTFTDPYAGLLTGETDVAIVRPPFAAALELHELAASRATSRCRPATRWPTASRSRSPRSPTSRG